MYDYIIVAGNGKTSRANIEALVDDYIYANPEIKFNICNSSGLSEGQVWLKQYLDDKEIPWENTKEPTPSEGSISSALFILWNDEDTESLNALAYAKDNGLPAFDLTDGLVELVPQGDVQAVVAPVMPEQEVIPESEETSVDTEDEEYGEEFEDPLYEAINIVASIFAEAIAKELKKVLKK